MLFFFQPITHYCLVIEFQNRGGAHFHMLLTLARDISTPTDIDEFISATIPDKRSNEELHTLVTEKMMHGRCRPKCKKKDGGCKVGYPFAFCDETIMDDGRGKVAYRYTNSYIFIFASIFRLHRRPDDGATYVAKDKRVYTNQHVVPYNAATLLFFQSHCNVLYVKSTKQIIYVFKYMFKKNELEVHYCENS
jgi:hypothetical protein